MRRYQSKYSKQQESTIRFNIMEALQNLAKFQGIDIETMKSTAPYSYELSKVTSQKVSAELKKLVDYGLVVRDRARGKTVKYMLRGTYEDLMKGEDSDDNYGYGDYRDEVEPSEERIKMERYAAAATREKHEEMW